MKSVEVMGWTFIQEALHKATQSLEIKEMV
jgi:hypothetical protein